MRGNLNKQGNWLVEENFFFRNRYYYDACLDNDWQRVSTDQDADYFSVWYNEETMQILTYAEGDVSLVTCLNSKQYEREFRAMWTFYKGENR